eukprot:TRINITY_DN12252_c0_g1_i1.p2 TRINITY_DN12252_c0_g1~~TRINITY_DN12252_c0_g1_i1.p2  ORF type:complete len:168 (-),score=62.18 TRINITY_DN12252_c0_g1_i1:57-560(-)
MADVTEEKKVESWKNLMNWKSTYANNKGTEAEAFKWLWENFDAEKISIYEFVYKYNDEIDSGMQANNAIKGTLQRWERARKVACGIMSVLKGGETPYIQSGAWIFLGTEVPKEISELGSDDFELYTPRKLNPEDKEDKRTFESYFEFGDEVYHNGKVHEHYDGAKFL